MNNYSKILDILLGKLTTMPMQRFLILVALAAFGMVLFALPDIITAIRWW
ncbi:hypothetical protein ACFBZI_08605 [Moraxella sp. ZJ142]